jgi:hypothetical protein
MLMVAVVLLAFAAAAAYAHDYGATRSDSFAEATRSDFLTTRIGRFHSSVRGIA